MKNEHLQTNYYINVNNEKSVYIEEYDKVLVKVEQKIKEDEQIKNEMKSENKE